MTASAAFAAPAPGAGQPAAPRGPKGSVPRSTKGDDRAFGIGIALLVGAGAHLLRPIWVDPALAYAYSWLLVGLASAVGSLAALFNELIDRGLLNVSAKCRWAGRFAQFFVPASAVILFAAILWYFLLNRQEQLNFSNEHTSVSLESVFRCLTWTLLGLCFAVWLCDELILDRSTHPASDSVLWLDFMVLGAVFVTHVAATFYDGVANANERFVQGYFAGAVAFEVIIANLLFDPAPVQDRIGFLSGENPGQARQRRQGLVISFLVIMVLIMVLILVRSRILHPSSGHAPGPVTESSMLSPRALGKQL
jgi:hypothetical protein